MIFKTDQATAVAEKRQILALGRAGREPEPRTFVCSGPCRLLGVYSLVIVTACSLCHELTAKLTDRRVNV